MKGTGFKMFFKKKQHTPSLLLLSIRALIKTTIPMSLRPKIDWQESTMIQEWKEEDLTHPSSPACKAPTTSGPGSS